MNATLVILVNEHPDFDAFTSGLQNQYGDLPGLVVLRRQEPQEWWFQSKLQGKEVDGQVTIGGKEFARACKPEDAGQVFLELLEFITQRGRMDAE